MHESARTIFAQARRDFVRAWRPLAATAILFKVAAFVVLAPLSGLLLRLLVTTSGSAALADQQILFFLLTPLGLAGLLAFGAFSLAIVALQQAGLMLIARGAAGGRRLTALTALAQVARHARPVLALATLLTARALLLAAPFLAAAAGLYLWLLTDYDINFYLAARPPRFWLAVALIALVLAALLAALVRQAVGWLMSLPTLLFERVAPRRALTLAIERARGRRRQVVGVLVGWLAAVALLSSVSSGLVVGLGRLLTPMVMHSQGLLVLALGLLLLLWFLAGQTVTFLNGAGFALLVTRLYGQARPADDQPRVEREEARRPAPGPDAVATPAAPALPRLSMWLVTGAALIVLPAATAVAALAVNGLRSPSDVRVTGHRGAARWAPENTLAAVQRAIDDGADQVEIDVQETADGQVVVAHDSDFMKLAGVPTKVWDATWDELRRIDIGSSFGPEFADQRPPSLTQVLETARGRAEVNIELKDYGHDEMLEQRVVDIVEGLNMQGEVVVMSLSYPMVQRMRGLRPDWTVGLLTAVAIGDLTRLDADFLAVNAGLATGAFVRAAHRAGKQVLVWTINDPLTAYAMISRGVDGVITDDPAMALRVKETYNRLTGLERLLVEVALLIGIIDLDDDAPQEIG